MTFYGEKPNRILVYEAKVQAALDSGQKADGTGPITIDLDEYERTLNLDLLEQVAYQNAQARAHVTGVLSTGEAQIVYQSISAGSRTGWAKDVSLARKVTITTLMGQLVSRGRGRRR